MHWAESNGLGLGEIGQTCDNDDDGDDDSDEALVGGVYRMVGRLEEKLINNVEFTFVDNA